MLKIRWSCNRLIFNMGILTSGKDSLYIEKIDHVIKGLSLNFVSSVAMLNLQSTPHINGLVQERHQSGSSAMELCLSCTNSSILHLHGGGMGVYCKYKLLHFGDITWTSWHFKSLAIYPFVQQLVEVNTKYSKQSKLALLGFCEGIKQVTSRFPSQSAINSLRPSDAYMRR